MAELTTILETALLTEDNKVYPHIQQDNLTWFKQTVTEVGAALAIAYNYFPDSLGE